MYLMRKQNFHSHPCLKGGGGYRKLKGGETAKGGTKILKARETTLSELWISMIASDELLLPITIPEVSEGDPQERD